MSGLIQGEFNFFEDLPTPENDKGATRIFNDIKEDVTQPSLDLDIEKRGQEDGTRNNETRESSEAIGESGLSNSDGVAGVRESNITEELNTGRDLSSEQLSSAPNRERDESEVRTAEAEPALSSDNGSSDERDLRNTSGDSRESNQVVGQRREIPQGLQRPVSSIDEKILYADLSFNSEGTKEFYKSFDQYMAKGHTLSSNEENNIKARIEDGILNGFKSVDEIAECYNTSLKYKLDYLENTLGVQLDEIPQNHLIDMLHPERSKHVGDNILSFKSFQNEDAKFLVDDNSPITQVMSTLQPQEFSRVVKNLSNSHFSFQTTLEDYMDQTAMSDPHAAFQLPIPIIEEAPVNVADILSKEPIPIKPALPVEVSAKDESEKFSFSKLNMTLPEEYKSVLVARQVTNDSELISDYHGHITNRQIIISLSKHGRNNFNEMRKAAHSCSLDEVKHLVEKDEEFEHKETWSRGAGYYLKDGHSHKTGWDISKEYWKDRKDLENYIKDYEIDSSLYDALGINLSQDNKIEEPVVEVTPEPISIESPAPVVDENIEPVVEVAPEPISIESPAPVVDENTRNYRITDIDSLVPVGNISKVKANILAIQTLKAVESEERDATKEEQEIMSHYTGWGGLKNIFKTWDIPDNYKPYSEQVINLLSETEYENARHSTLNAHYTSPEIVQSMWKSIEDSGFKGGNILEPAGGIGHFIGLMPEHISKRSKIYTVECDSISSRIMGKLYPDSINQTAFFEDAALRNNSMDLVISNVPFLDNAHRDIRYDKMNIHDYFFVRSMDCLKPGGAMMAITTSGTLDSSRSVKARKTLSEKADFIGAVRLPSNAFKKNAGAEVTTDILYLRKKDDQTFEQKPFLFLREFENLEKIGPQYKENKQSIQDDIDRYKLKLEDASEYMASDYKKRIKEYTTDYNNYKIEINQYYVDNPDKLIGFVDITSGRYGREFEKSLVSNGEELKPQLDKAMASFSKDIFVEQEVSIPAPSEDMIADAGLKPYSIQIVDNKVVQNIEGFLEPVKGMQSTAMKKRAEDFISVRDAAIEAVNSQVDSNLSEDQVESRRLELVEAFDYFQKKHGSPWKPANQRLFKTDPEFPLLLSLQEQKTVEINGEIQDQFIEVGLLQSRTSWPLIEPTRAENLEDALDISIAYKGEIDEAYIEKLLNSPREVNREEILKKGFAFEEPLTGQLTERSEYLSGNVRKKFETTSKFLDTNPQYQNNVDELEKVLPEEVGIDRIRFQLGSSWIDESVLNQWGRSKINGRPTFTYNKALSSWMIKGDCDSSPEYSTERVDTKTLIQQTLNLKTVQVFDTVKDSEGKEKRVLNQKETAFAIEKQEMLKADFREFVTDNTELSKNIEHSYNTQFNGFANREYKAAGFKQYPGASNILTLRDYQKKTVSRGIVSSVLLAMAVGSGKSACMMTIAQEKKRLGIANKSMIVVQNATVAQFAAGYKALYPSSKVLAPLNKNEYNAQNRHLFLSRIASNDWDAVIIPQSFFNLIKDDVETVEAFYQEQINDLEMALYEAKGSGADKDVRTVRQLQKNIDKLQGDRDRYLKEKRDDTLTFNQLGVDCLMLDEAHEYKKLGIATKMGATKGLDTAVSKRAQKAFMKIRSIREKSNGNNVVLATGTPITNTLAELYTMIRMTDDSVLKEYGVSKFDDFASAFTETVTEPELTATNNLKMVTRLSKFVNQPQLIQMFRQSSEVLTSSQLNDNKEVLKPEIIGGKPQAFVIERGEWLGEYVEKLKEELEEFESMEGSRKRENSHIPLTVTTRAKKAAVDPRLIGHVEGMATPPDDHNSKTNTAVKEILRIAEETNDLNGTQMIFSDNYQSSDGKFNLFQDMKQKLVQGGMNEDEIAIIHDYKTDAQKEKLFADMNSGRVRVLFGTTQKMGVGVNAQERMKALHHLDCPWTPAWLEQRNGRILRHGNIFAQSGSGVYIQTYGVEKTMDAAIYQKIATKQSFIDQVLSGQVNSVEVEDATEEMKMSAQEFTALFSGNPNVMLKFKLDNEIKALEQQKSSWKKQLQSNRNNLRYAEENLEAFKSRKEKVESKTSELNAYSKNLDGKRIIEINGREIPEDKMKESIEGIFLAHIRNALDDATGYKNSSSENYNYKIPEVVKVNGKKVDLGIHVPINWNTGKVQGDLSVNYFVPDLAPYPIQGMVGTAYGAINSMKSSVKFEAGDNPKNLESSIHKNIQKTEERIASIKDFLKKPFRREEELEQKYEELNSIVETEEQTEGSDMKSGSNLKMWLSEQDLDGLAKNLNLTAEEEDKLRGFVEGDDQNLPLSVVWKLDNIINQENIVVMNEDIEKEQAEGDLVKAFNSAESELSRMRGESSMKQFESTQINTESVGREMLIAENDYNCLSMAMHGKCNDGQTWNHMSQSYVDEAYVPYKQDRFTDAASPDYVKSLTQKYNGKVASLRSRANIAQGKVAQARSSRT
jgi:N12 class adenine-specific DNA methylase